MQRLASLGAIWCAPIVALTRVAGKCAALTFALHSSSRRDHSAHVADTVIIDSMLAIRDFSLGHTTLP